MHPMSIAPAHPLRRPATLVAIIAAALASTGCLPGGSDGGSGGGGGGGGGGETSRGLLSFKDDPAISGSTLSFRIEFQAPGRDERASFPVSWRMTRSDGASVRTSATIMHKDTRTETFFASPRIETPITGIPAGTTLTITIDPANEVTPRNDTFKVEAIVVPAAG